ncbi:energy transducer TonB [Burkholderia ambifaria]|uniref:Outer membrane transport energization protein TonB n=1 Tax=Burkholderia ambifaria (strain ATCC BAA-244 / DSM 16087 / CCUG 44356 / LMG 19182 / AMMD) TaxID=339670 RepID=Q0BDI0_BURCM|nr:energy transducer TonB [Burkholderia ambifaria]ABI87793.1 outer membrane transport energization protein TonB [Burkholderia ambifaria AMMD]ELK6209582.1 energy transducer TonB [Burkholderia ambifaria]MBR7929279.1 energy transducer TonB [Burkholderia ambifaria]MBR8187238.1 energy transducer TonB [Burkholderia ambifaria]MBR8348734.1 energy transducer TonB [Burkholderia ambifaria]
MQASQSAPAGILPAAPRMNPRVITVAVGVLAAHAIMLTAAWLHRNAPPPKSVEVQSITAQLITPAPIAQQVAAESIPQPAPPKPTPRVKPKVEPKPVQKAAKPAPQPVAQSPAPSPTPAPAADPTPAPAAPAAAAPAATPSPARETMQVSAPKNVPTLQCNFVKPDYPSMSRRRGESGTAYVHFVVGVTGKIESVELQKSSGYPRLDDAALDAMRSTTCRPYIENGQAIRAARTQPYNFGLTD